MGKRRQEPEQEETDGSDKTHRTREAPEDLSLNLGATSGLSCGVEEPVRNLAWKWRRQLGSGCHKPGAEAVAVSYRCTFWAAVPTHPGGGFLCTLESTKAGADQGT